MERMNLTSDLLQTESFHQLLLRKRTGGLSSKYIEKCSVSYEVMIDTSHFRKFQKGSSVSCGRHFSGASYVTVVPHVVEIVVLGA